jgi:K(+)-stimulated pyrophosphate-energized sodium pump
LSSISKAFVEEDTDVSDSGSVFSPHQRTGRRWPTGILAGLGALVLLLTGTAARASEAELKIPDLGSVNFVGVSGHNLLLFGLLICIGGMVFGLVQYTHIRRLPVHKSMLEISELIYETCKTYLITQGKFLAVLWAFIAAIMVIYFGFLLGFSAGRVFLIIVFSIIGILGS